MGGERDKLNDRPELTCEDCLDEMLVCRCLPTSGTPREQIYRLIGWEVAVALDPHVSEEARNLMQRAQKMVVRELLTALNIADTIEEAESILADKYVQLGGKVSLLKQPIDCGE